MGEVTVHKCKAQYFRMATGAVVLAAAVSSSMALGQSAAAPQAQRSAAPAEEDAQTQRPNVLIWMIDDLGFGQIGSYGGIVDTPNLDRLAERGLRYTNYRTTPVCSASRAALLSGRQSHAIGMGSHVATAVPFPGYDGHIPHGAGTLAENLRQAGYQTYAIGKWDHLALENVSESGPQTYLPVRQGFNRFYGFLAADADNFRPLLWQDQTPITLPADPDYHLSKDMADKAIAMIDSRDTQIERPPFFIYWATGAVHAPHHAPDAYLERYRGRFDMGWDVARQQILDRQIAMGLVPAGTRLPPLSPDMIAWDTLGADAKRINARQMEAFAASLTYADEQFGRILDELERRGERDNTIVIVTADNGASGEGGPHGFANELQFSTGRPATDADNLPLIDEWGRAGTYPNYSINWAMAGNTPFRYYKQTTFEGGIHVPLIVSWPDRIKDFAALRRQSTFVADITPTVLDAAQVPPAEMVNNTPQIPFDGKSFAESFADAGAAPSSEDQYFEMFGNRAIISDGWKVVVPHYTKVWSAAPGKPFEGEKWELYHLAQDINELDNVADRNPDQVARLDALFDEVGRKYNVLPLHNFDEGRVEMGKRMMAQFASLGGKWQYPEETSRIHWSLAPPVMNLPFHYSGDVDLASAGASAPIWIIGGRYGGMSLDLKGGHPVFAARFADLTVFRLQANGALTSGAHKVGLCVMHGVDGADISITVDGQKVASGKTPQPLPVTVQINEGLSIGSAPGTPVAGDYPVPARFPGTVKNSTFDFWSSDSGLVGCQ